LSTWLDKLLLQPWLHYDVHHYLTLVEKGFIQHPSGSVFFPLHPLSIRAMGALLGHPLAAAMLLNLVEHLVLVVCFYRLISDEFSPSVGRWSVAALLTFPLSFLLAVPYSEAPFLIFVILAFWAAHRRRWPIAGLAGLFAAALRQPGLLLLPALGLEWLIWALRERQLKAWLKGLWLGLIPIVPFSFSAYLYRVGITSVSPLNPLSPLLWIAEIQDLYWHSHFVMPWETVKIILERGSQDLAGPFLIDLLWTLVITALALASLWVWRRPGLSVYTVLMIVASWTKVLVPPSPSPIESFPRHIMVAFPLFLVIGRLLERRPLSRIAWWVLAPPVLLIQTALFIRNAWIP
jgi:hypothetical protein